ncbi:hypothetical protein TRVA0_001S08240 [Trichomonascus vanleenenianus]|uniref:uncharacterized protein n=1 Tax=Trichomonascus vanleenenianus TaxID=2268995 RepID=UPI003ECA4279
MFRLRGGIVDKTRTKSFNVAFSLAANVSAAATAGTMIPVTVPEGVDLDKEQLEKFGPFQRWKTRMERSLREQKDVFELSKIQIQNADFFGNNRLGFLKFKAHVTHTNGKHVPGVVVLRGDSVAMLVIVTVKEDPSRKYVVLTRQPRVAAGNLSLTELPAGMIDDGTFVGAAAREIEEECGFKIEESDLKELNLKSKESDSGWFSSPGLLDEQMQFFLYERTMPESEIGELKGKLTGDENEVISLELRPLETFFDEPIADAKALMALALYKLVQ